jgi:hypothetical protein
MRLDRLSFDSSLKPLRQPRLLRSPRHRAREDWVRLTRDSLELAVFLGPWSLGCWCSPCGTTAGRQQAKVGTSRTRILRLPNLQSHRFLYRLLCPAAAAQASWRGARTLGRSQQFRIRGAKMARAWAAKHRDLIVSSEWGQKTATSLYGPNDLGTGDARSNSVRWVEFTNRFPAASLPECVTRV